MKLYKSLTLYAIVTLGLASTACSDWLDYEPKDKQTYDQQFATSAGFHNVVNGIYNQISTSNLYGQNLSYGAIDVMGACYNTPTSNYLYYDFCHGYWTNTRPTATFKSIWTTAYNTMLNINVLLEAMDEYPDVLSEVDAKMIRGEMLAMRGMLHLDLTRLFGPVYSRNPQGLAVPYADTSEIIKRERMTADSILTYKILPDLTEAQKLLKEVDPVITDGVLNSDGGLDGNWERYRQLRLNYYAVTLLKARAYIWMNDYNNALVETKKITDDSKVLESFPWVNAGKLLGNASNPDRGYSTECLFGLYNNKISDIFAYTFSGSLDPSSVMQPRRGYVAILFPNASDYRRQSQWASSASSSSDFDFVKYKGFTANSTNPEFWASFYGLMRTSEAYFIACEAEMNGNNDIAAAVNYLNVVRAARGEEPMAESTTKTALTKELKYEYLRDLRGEGQIYFLHKRNYQAFGQWSGGQYDLDGAGTCDFIDDPSVATRYNVPIPTGENY